MVSTCDDFAKNNGSVLVEHFEPIWHRRECIACLYFKSILHSHISISFVSDNTTYIVLLLTTLTKDHILWSLLSMILIGAIDWFYRDTGNMLLYWTWQWTPLKIGKECWRVVSLPILYHQMLIQLTYLNRLILVVLWEH